MQPTSSADSVFPSATAPNLPPPPGTSQSLLLLAVGGGAAAVLPRILEGWPNPPDAAAIDTDQLAIDATSLPRACVIGHNATRSHSAGGDPSIGLLAAKSDTERIRSLLAGHNVLVLLACLGGGTASGAAPYVAQLARDAGLLVVAFVTTPFDIEGQRRADCAADAIEALRHAADIVIRLPNQALHALLPPDTPLADSFAFVNRMLTAAIRSLWTLLARENILNIDISDLQFLVENSGNECRFGYAEASGRDRAATAVRILLDGPMLEHARQLANAGAILLSVLGDPTLTLAELSAIQTAVRDRARDGAQILVSAAILPNWTGQLAIVLLAANNAPAAYVRPAPPAPAGTVAASAAPRPHSSSRRARKTGQGGQGTLFSAQDAEADAAQTAESAPSPADSEPIGGFPPASLLDTPAFQRQGLRFSK
ncbi:MAG: cell division FtsZ family protein [Kiritimatiellae bacterium]|nr:cell division FtsZ family protein [Kiritimatiellia bacterium]